MKDFVKIDLRKFSKGMIDFKTMKTRKKTNYDY